VLNQLQTKMQTGEMFLESEVPIWNVKMNW